jgi:hypothetical protein
MGKCLQIIAEFRQFRDYSLHGVEIRWIEEQIDVWKPFSQFFLLARHHAARENDGDLRSLSLELDERV